jgi:hypothetical protein
MFLFDLANNSQSFLLDTGWMDSGLEENVQRFMGWQDNGTLSFEIEMTCGKVSLFDIYKKEFTSEMYPAATPRPVFWPTPPVTPVGTICPPLPTPTASP